MSSMQSAAVSCDQASEKGDCMTIVVAKVTLVYCYGKSVYSWQGAACLSWHRQANCQRYSV